MTVNTQERRLHHPSAATHPPEPQSPAAQQPSGWFGSLDSWLLKRLVSGLGSERLAFQLWDGREAASPERIGGPCVRIADRATLWKLVLNPAFYLPQCYAEGTVTLDGDLVEVLTAEFLQLARDGRCLERPWSRWGRKGSGMAAAQRNIHHHYNLGNDFYRLWLDREMVYTCAWFPHEQMSLEDAQLAKMDLVCRKLRLRPGEHVVEAGCGWGGLSLHMARKYGVNVTAYNISREQIRYARERADREGLTNRVTFVEDDWRNIRGKFDAFASVGMLEHVGLALYDRLGALIRRVLAPHGRGLLHSIGMPKSRRLSSWTEHCIFPGAQPPALSELLTILEPHGLEVVDVENLRRHYAETLRNWLTRFDAAADTVCAMFEERFVRMWRFYLAASAAAFESGSLELFQVVFAPIPNNYMPRSRVKFLGEGAPAGAPGPPRG